LAASVQDADPFFERRKPNAEYLVVEAAELVADPEADPEASPR
jgi:hypothetical protein